MITVLMLFVSSFFQLNGTGCAVTRVLKALVETHQDTVITSSYFHVLRPIITPVTHYLKRGLVF